MDGTVHSVVFPASVFNVSFLVADRENGAVPEPSTFALLATGAIGLIGYRRRKRKQAA